MTAYHAERRTGQENSIDDQSNENTNGQATGLPSEGLVDQLEDRRLCKAEALGSNPSKSIIP